MVPFLTFLFESYQFPQEHILHMAIATSMTTILFTAISSVRAQQKKKMIRWDIVIALAPGIFWRNFRWWKNIFCTPRPMVNYIFC